ncbi:MAG: peptide-methionine (S)-S-oxide reductase MsrA [Planctomycetota bacterium]
MTADASSSADTPAADRTEVATLAAGCYWCIEAVLQEIPGVIDVKPGFMGGKGEHVTYKDVCRGDTGHAEVVRIEFNPAVLPYPELLEWFWKLHDPTTLNRQGADIGTQYRSAIFYHSPEQQQAAEASKRAAQASGHFDAPIVTEITAASEFIPGPEDHEDYYRRNRQAGYCRAVIAPKMRKLGLEE